MSAARVVSLIGLPGAGKTTLGKALAARLGERCTYFGVGEELRRNAEEDPALRERLDSGELGSETIVLRMVSEAYASCATELLILDGFPRHAAQTRFGRELFDRWTVLFLDVTREIAMARLKGRRYCARCGVLIDSEELSDPCPVCGGQAWRSRAEDRDVILYRRLQGAQADLLHLLNTMVTMSDFTRLDLHLTADAALHSALNTIS